jgi:hypothetical protein
MCGRFHNGHDLENVRYLTIEDYRAFNNPRMLGKVVHLRLFNWVDGFIGLAGVPILEFDFTRWNKEPIATHFIFLGKNQKIVFPLRYLKSSAFSYFSRNRDKYDFIEEIDFKSSLSSKVVLLRK